MTAGVRRYQGRKVLNRVSGIDACGGCGRRVLDPDTGVIYAKSSRGYVVTIGLVRCGRIWFCPECSSAIRRGRTEEIKTGALRHLAAGGTLAVVVLTARHNRTTDLSDLVAALWGGPLLDAAGAPVLDRAKKARRAPGAYQRMLTAPAFYGRPEARRTRKDGSQYVRPAEDGIRHRIGYIGMVRAAEVTRSWENGYHPHLNLLVFLGGEMAGTPAKGDVVDHFEPSEDALTEWEDWLRDMWAGALKRADPSFEPSTDCSKHGCKCEGKGHGVMVHIIKSADDTALIDYLTKAQDGTTGSRTESVDQDLEAAAGAAMETARGDSKTGRGRKSMTPFQMLYRLWDIEVAGLDPDAAEGYGAPKQLRAWWAQYEEALAGRRAIEWTRGLRRHVDLDGDDDEETDLEYVYESEAAPLDGGIILTAEAVGLVVGADAELDIEDVVRAEAYDSAVDIVTALDGRASHVRIVGAEQLAEVQEALFARTQARAEESRRQRRIAEYEADQAEADRHRLHLAGMLAQLLANRSAE
ncbi:replication protein [Streptomyces sp. WAC01280]|uniref:replication protein n=1 Tax=Streptomyces sp. WAC01280 TaxID=2487424 RepID=UPI000F7962A6|nr:replication protein [Streptomyces sp. WAC01280]RSS59828.1 replication protein [Streptomyces sp. WAC01280]